MWNCIGGSAYGHGGWLFGHGPFGMMLPLLVAVVIILVVVWIFRSLSSKGGVNKDTSDSLEIIKVKFARGEITEEEYLRLRDILTR